MRKLILFLSLGMSMNVMAFPKAPFDALTTPVDSFKMLDEDSDFEYDFEGIVKLSNCSGSIIRFPGQPDATNAYVLTNGHCLSGPLMKPGTVITNRTLRRVMQVADSKKNFISIVAKKLVYATMTGTDAAIYELKETYADLAKRGIDAFDLDTAAPIVGLPIDVVSGYWERGYRCHVAATVFELREHSYVFTNSIRYSDEGCKIIGGTSGSPVIQKDTRVVVAVNNTINESGAQCTMNNPCEVDDEGNISVFLKSGYGQQTYMFHSCLTADFRIDLNKEGCSLPKP